MFKNHDSMKEEGIKKDVNVVVKTSSSFGGINVALVFKKYKEREIQAQ
jgi:3-oxoacyl-(acyl-carrier-protein) synthase